MTEVDKNKPKQSTLAPSTSIRIPVSGLSTPMSDFPSQTFDKRYIIGKTIGNGAFGKVKEATHILSGQKLAIKILDKSKIKKKDDEVRIAREIIINLEMHHPNIVQLYEVPD